MRVVITGAAGAIGSYLLRRFRDDGARCVGLDEAPHPGVDRCDVSEIGELARAFEHAAPDLVVHCAAQMDVDGQRDPVELVRANILGFANVCSLLKGSKAILIFMSSRGVYPWLRSGQLPPELTEETACSVDVERSIYDLSKFTEEMIAKRYRLQYGLCAVGFRLSSTFGLGKDEATHGHQSVLNRMFDAARSGNVFRIHGTGQASDFVYYGDIYQACLRVAWRRTAPSAEVYNISAGARPIAEYVTGLRRVFPDARIEAEGGIDYLNTGGYGYVNMSHRLASSDLGYAPAYSPALAFEEMQHLVGGRARPWTVSFSRPLSSRP